MPGPWTVRPLHLEPASLSCLVVRKIEKGFPSLVRLWTLPLICSSAMVCVQV